jgi:hypothetical protein
MSDDLRKIRISINVPDTKYNGKLHMNPNVRDGSSDGCMIREVTTECRLSDKE